MKLRDYINDPSQQIDLENTPKAYLVAIKVIDLLKNGESESAFTIIDRNIVELYKALDIDSFCCLVNFYTTNIEIEARYLSAIHKNGIPKLLINLCKDGLEKDKRYFIEKLNEYNNSQSWLDVLTIMDILIQKTDIDKLQIYKSKFKKLTELKRYDEVLSECEKLISGDYKSDRTINQIKLDTLIISKKFGELEEYLIVAEYILDPVTISKGYIALGKYYESNKEVEKAYSLYTRARQLNPDFKMPVTADIKVNGVKNINSKVKGFNIKGFIDNIKSNKKHKTIAMIICVGLVAIIGLSAFNKNAGSKDIVTSEQFTKLYNLEKPYEYMDNPIARVDGLNFGKEENNLLTFNSNIVTNDIENISIYIDGSNIYNINQYNEFIAFNKFLKLKTGKDYTKKIQKQIEESHEKRTIDERFIDNNKVTMKIKKGSVDESSYIAIEAQLK